RTARRREEPVKARGRGGDDEAVRDPPRGGGAARGGLGRPRRGPPADGAGPATVPAGGGGGAAPEGGGQGPVPQPPARRPPDGPRLRARQTASGVAEHWHGQAPPLVECEALAPGGKKRRLAEALEEGRGDEIAVVGHNPDLSELVGWLLGDRTAGIDLAKAGVA